MYNLCIFDLDGTLADTVESIAYSANLALQELGFKQQPVDSFHSFAGDGIYELSKRCLAASGDIAGEKLEEFLQKYRQYLSKNYMYHVKPFAGITELLEQLKKAKVKLSVLSNKPHLLTVGVTEELFGKEYFDYVQGQIDGMKRKPDPEGALYLAEQAGVKPQECLYIGDTNTDMQTGNSAGMTTVGVLWGFRRRKELEAHHANHIIVHPSEIFNIVKDGQ